LRKLLTGAGCAVVASASLAVAAGAIAQEPEATFNATVSPRNAGTASNPQNTKLGFQMTVNKPQTTVEFIDLQLPRGLKMSGKGFRRCSLDTIGRNPGDCPTGSKAGPIGDASAELGPNNTPLEFTVQSYVVNNTTLGFYVSETTGIQVQAPLEGKLTDKGRHLRITIPFELRQPVAGLDASLTGLKQTFSARRNGNYIVSSVGCRKRKHRISAELTFSERADGAPVPGVLSARDTAGCRK
jgi:hypothetical protein